MKFIKTVFLQILKGQIDLLIFYGKLLFMQYGGIEKNLIFS